MKSLQDYLTESEQWINTPAEGDTFAIELDDEVLCETYIIEVADNCILLDSTEDIVCALSESLILEDTNEGNSGVILETMGYGTLVGEEDDVAEDQSAGIVAQKEMNIDAAQDLAMDEAEYQGRKVALGKPMQGDVKKFKVYVKDPVTGNVKKVNFGDKTMRIKKSNPARRKSFRARHNCANPGPRTKARYWSCRKW
jgi:hypothetical protein